MKLNENKYYNNNSKNFGWRHAERKRVSVSGFILTETKPLSQWIFFKCEFIYTKQHTSINMDIETGNGIWVCVMIDIVINAA